MAQTAATVANELAEERICSEAPAGAAATSQPAPVQRFPAGGVLNQGAQKGLVVLFDQGLCGATTFLAGMFVARACSKTYVRAAMGPPAFGSDGKDHWAWAHPCTRPDLRMQEIGTWSDREA